MDKKLRIIDDHWTYGSYHRIHYKKDMLYTFFQYVDIHFVWNVGMGSFSLQDRLVERLRAKGLISEETACRYHETALQFLSQMADYDPWPIEDIYGQIRQIRRKILGEDVLAADWQQRCAGFEGEASVGWGVDQRAKKEDLLQKKESILFALCQPEYFSQMVQDIKAALERGNKVYLLVVPEEGMALPSRHAVEAAWKTLSSTDKSVENIGWLFMTKEGTRLDFSEITGEGSLQADVEQNRAALMVYGEEGLIHCRNLQIESIVHAIPYGYHARAMVNQLDGGRPCVVYVPSHFDITRWVTMTEKTKVSYWQLWQLWKDHGDRIYDLTVDQLYDGYPQYFLNVYENGQECPEAQQEYPIRISVGTGVSSETICSYYDLRDQAIADYMNQRPGVTYLSTYFTKDMEQISIPWDHPEQQTGILVQGVRVAAAEKARIIHCDSTMTLRQQLQCGTMAPGLQLYSNFLFFMTPKLTELYNKLREDRPREQLREKQGHLDYQLYWQDGHRVESFPLYRKAVLAKKRDGRFLMCQYALGGGELKITGAGGVQVWLGWSAEAVNSPKEIQKVQVYTPYLSWKDEGDGMYANTYRQLVGAGRVNLVIIQDRIHCIRRGDVVLPSIGVVISLEETYGLEMLASLGVPEQEMGYFESQDLSVKIELDGPARIDPAQWQQVEWAYGGGLSLITDGQSIYDGEEIWEMNEVCGAARMKEEGWLSPLSRQTQESALHTLVKHPRTVIGIAKNGDLFVLVFSGRTRLSTGADYQEMCHIARKLISDAEDMMNVDGGGSSVLGMAVDGNFMELSYPATSMNSCAGMVRRVNTVLCLEV